jgi:2-polyprenyl-3-methyl-5-hydroxy-6-metoxy-1,4-benzoquinol methylase
MFGILNSKENDCIMGEYTNNNTNGRMNVIDNEEKNRINWIVSKVIGSSILDVGPSNGKVSIITGREGKKVLCINDSITMIEEALNYLQKEDLVTQKNVTFRQSNIFVSSFNERFDTIILQNFLNNAADLTTLFVKINGILQDNGRIIVTTPFGNDFNSSINTFYLKKFLDLQQKIGVLTDIYFSNSWVGVIYQKSEGEKTQLSNELLEKLEKAFIKKEMWLANNIYFLDNNLDKIDEYKKKFLREKVEKVKFQNELLEQYKKERQILNAYQKLKEKFDKLSKEHNKVRTQYSKLSKSKLGKITLKYWNLRRAKRGK